VNRAVDARRQRDLARLIDGYLTTQLLYVAAKLGVADVLADGPRTAAYAVGADADVLARILRGLVLEDVLAEAGEGRFALTALGEGLREGVAGSLRGAVLVRGEVYWSAAPGLLRSAIEGGTALEHVHGERFFDHLAAEPEREAVFQASMADRARREVADVVAVYDFAGLGELVDVGGGSGVLLEAILRATPGLRGVLVDRPEAVAQAERRLAAAGLDGRWECVVGDFFDAVPAGARAYLLSRVIHDWDDADAARVLATCRAAMSGDGRLLLVEGSSPSAPTTPPRPSAWTSTC
jgi:O-methyltransferase domain